MISFGNSIARVIEPADSGQRRDTTTGTGGLITEGAILSTSVSSLVTEGAVLSIGVSGPITRDTISTEIVSSSVARVITLTVGSSSLAPRASILSH